jgi:hypothetical protein
MDADPIVVGDGDIDAARARVDGATDAEPFLYPGDRHSSPTASCRRTTRTPPPS